MHVIRRLLVMTVLLAFAGCATEVALQQPTVRRGWDDSVLAALDDAHQRLQQVRDPEQRISQALHIADALFEMEALEAADHYAQIAFRTLQQSEYPLFDQAVTLIRVLYALDQTAQADRLLQSTLDTLTLSGNEPLQGQYLTRILQLVFSLDEPTADQFRRITDRVLFIGDPGIRSQVLRETIQLMWQANFSGDVTGIVQHAIAATSGVDDRVAQAAGFIHLASLIELLNQPIAGVDAEQIRARGLRIWRDANLWSIGQLSAATAVQGSMLTARAELLEEVLAGIPGNVARVEILTKQAFWYIETGLLDQAERLVEYAAQFSRAIDSAELRAGAVAQIGLVHQLLDDPATAQRRIEEAAAMSPRYWHTNPAAAYAAGRVLIENGQFGRAVQLIGSQRDPVHQVEAYLRLYSELDDDTLAQSQSLLLRELPFLLRRIGWSRSNHLPDLVQQTIIRAARRGDTALIAELRSIRPPQEMQVLLDSRYAQAMLERGAF